MVIGEVQLWVRRAPLIFIFVFLLFRAGCSPSESEEHPAPTTVPQTPTIAPTETPEPVTYIHGKFTPPDGQALMIDGLDFGAVVSLRTCGWLSSIIF